MNSILLAVPCYGGIVSDETTRGLYNSAKFFDRAGIRNELILVANESLISHGRSNIANFFINNTEHSHIMCIDADIGFFPEDIAKLMELNVEFATAPYSMKTVPPKYNFGLTANTEWLDNKACTVSHIGTGFQLVNRSVFEKIAKAYPELRCIPNTTRQLSDKEKQNSYHYYDTMLINGQMIPEDFSFEKRWRNIGGKIWMRPDIKLHHIGSHVFTGDDDLEGKLKELTNGK